MGIGNTMNRAGRRVIDVAKSDETSKVLRNLGAAAGGFAAGTYAFDRLKKKIQNEPRRKAILEDLQMNDPVISEEDPEKVLEYYATIYNFAPDLTLDKSAVKELLQHFVRFGRVDLQTLKTLADTEKSIKQSKDSRFSFGKGK
ncbi:MAG: hypothetical protein ACLFUH_09270 [Bacteroidales bacterium]